MGSMLPEAVNLPAEIAEMAALRARLRDAETDEACTSIYAEMASAGARYRAEIAALMAACGNAEDAEATVSAVAEAYFEIIRQIGDEALERLLLRVATISFATRLMDISRRVQDPGLA